MMAMYDIFLNQPRVNPVGLEVFFKKSGNAVKLIISSRSHQFLWMKRFNTLRKTPNKPQQFNSKECGGKDSNVGDSYLRFDSDITTLSK